MNKIEDIFKKSLENVEAPYDAKAWDSMASRLDQAMPTSQVKGSFKWAWIAGVVLVAGSSALYFVNQDAKPNVKTERTQNQSSIATQESTNEKSATQSNKLVSGAELAQSETLKTDGTLIATKVEKTATSLDAKNKQLTKDADKPLVETVQKNNLDTPVERIRASEFVKPVKEVKAPLEEKISKEHVLTKVDFSASNETFYEKGLPFNSLTSNVEAKRYKWSNERGEVLSNDRNADIHLFTAGTHLITLTVEYSSGEKQSVTKTVRCDVNYNLLAVTGFNPASSDYRNNTFIPFALLKTERNIPFDMQIIDPQSGQVIYETKSSDMPWDGIDVRTNQLVPVNSTYIWRVNIHEKAIGEPTNRYQGTITRI